MLARIFFVLAGLIITNADVSLANMPSDHTIGNSENIGDSTEIDLAIFDDAVFAETRIDIQDGH